MAQSYTAPSQVSNAEFLRWSQAPENAAYPDASSYNMNDYVGNGLSQPSYDQSVPAPSTQLARRPVNRQLVSTGQRPAYDTTGDPWGQFGDDSILDPQSATNGSMEENDNIELLEERAAIAKRDAQSKRKQIPPFVQKLSR
jgi:heat shock transcription factor